MQLNPHVHGRHGTIAAINASSTRSWSGPHFEAICRDYAIAADPGVFGGLPGEVGSGVVPDPADRTQIEVDVVVLAPAEPGRPRKILSLGEAKWTGSWTSATSNACAGPGSARR